MTSLDRINYPKLYKHLDDLHPDVQEIKNHKNSKNPFFITAIGVFGVIALLVAAVGCIFFYSNSVHFSSLPSIILWSSEFIWIGFMAIVFAGWIIHSKKQNKQIEAKKTEVKTISDNDRLTIDKSNLPKALKQRSMEIFKLLDPEKEEYLDLILELFDLQKLDKSYQAKLNIENSLKIEVSNNKIKLMAQINNKFFVLNQGLQKKTEMIRDEFGDNNDDELLDEIQLERLTALQTEAQEIHFKIDSINQINIHFKLGLNFNEDIYIEEKIDKIENKINFCKRENRVKYLNLIIQAFYLFLETEDSPQENQRIKEILENEVDLHKKIIQSCLEERIKNLKKAAQEADLQIQMKAKKEKDLAKAKRLEEEFSKTNQQSKSHLQEIENLMKFNAQFSVGLNFDDLGDD